MAISNVKGGSVWAVSIDCKTVHGLTRSGSGSSCPTDPPTRGPSSFPTASVSGLVGDPSSTQQFYWGSSTLWIVNSLLSKPRWTSDCLWKWTEARSCLQTSAASFFFFPQMECVANVEKLGHCTCGSEFSDLLKNYWIWHHWPLISWSHQLAVQDGLPPNSLWDHLPLLCYSLPPMLLHPTCHLWLCEAFSGHPLSTRHCASPSK